MAHGSTHFDVLAPNSKFYHGPFGRMFPDLPSWGADLGDAELMAIANDLMVERPGLEPNQIAQDPSMVAELDEEFESNIPAGYTYFGQFVDHDITFDPASSLMRRNDPNGLLNFRTPRFDLDNLYGRGHDDQPYLYDPDDAAKMAIGHIESEPDLPDLPRFKGRALIGDMRNDENAIVSQLQLAFLLAHNTLVDRAREQFPCEDAPTIFNRARTTLRWLYQYIVWHDFLPRVVIDEVHACALQLEDKCGGRKAWSCGLDDLFKWKHQPFMPVEFAVAAYRFGHSMVRNSYQTNAPVRGFQEFAPIFDNVPGSSGDDLRGGRPMLPKNCIQWDWFLEMETSRGPFPQRARKIDTKLCNALAFLPIGPAGSQLNVLAFRNLKRGITFDLPAGTAIARKLCVEPLKLKDYEPDSLWYYVLREGQKNGGRALGRVGSNILCAVFAGLLKGDPSSYFNMDPCWHPSQDPLLRPEVDNRDNDNWQLSSIIRLSGINPAGIGFA